MNGVIIMNKAAGETSFQLVRTVRRLINTKKVGHAGTLDPNAEGVLPILVGHATKLEPMLHTGTKSYTAEITFGIATDTEDIWGNVLSESEVHLSEACVREAVLSFEGGYLQTPPMYSAKKINGEKLYKLARNGQSVDRAAVYVELSEIRILEIALPKLTFSVTCSKGTYIRTLCKDIGEKLGIPACMSRLLRTRHGEFSLADAFTKEDLISLSESGELHKAVIPTEQFFLFAKRYNCSPEEEKALYNGNQIPAPLRNFTKDEKLRMMDSKNRFQAVYRYDADIGMMVPEQMFLQKEENE